MLRRLGIQLGIHDLNRCAWVPRRRYAVGSPTSVFCQEDGQLARHWQIIRSGAHILHSDLMPVAGGTDRGPSPKELLMSALASCTSMTIRMYADRSGFTSSLHQVSVEVEEFCDKDAHVPHSLAVRVRLLGDKAVLTKYQPRLLRVSNSCPVKKMIAGPVTIDTTLSIVNTTTNDA